MNEEYVIQMKGIRKIYPNGVVANQDVDLNVRKGEIHALMGENGAGKSTLMKMLFGLEQPTEGEIYVNGEKVHLSSPNVAISKGIGMVHQHFMLVPSLTVAENIVLGMTPKKNGIFIDRQKAIKITEEYSKKFNLAVDPNARVVDIPVGMKQKVEILKALVRGAKILILDEPTAVLTTQETTELFKELKHLKEQGYTLIFISHKLNEIMEITDRLSILRGGKFMGVYETKDVTPEKISRLMVGRDVVLQVQKDAAKPTEEILRVRDLHYVNDWGKKMLNGVSLSVRKGEILGIAGVEGNGQKELVDMLFGLNKPNEGTITMKGDNIIGLNQRQLREKHISLVPEDRMLFGIAANASIEENIISDRADSKKMNKGLMFNMKNMHEETDALIKEYKVLCKSRDQKVGMLSGGNIQKVVVAREFSNQPDLIIADQPTRGIDVGAKYEIYDLIIKMAKMGKTIIVCSSEMPEILGITNRIGVMSNGRLAGIVNTKETNQEELLRLSAMYL